MNIPALEVAEAKVMFRGKNVFSCKHARLGESSSPVPNRPCIMNYAVYMAAIRQWRHEAEAHTTAALQGQAPTQARRRRERSRLQGQITGTTPSPPATQRSTAPLEDTAAWWMPEASAYVAPNQAMDRVITEDELDRWIWGHRRHFQVDDEDEDLDMDPYENDEDDEDAELTWRQPR